MINVEQELEIAKKAAQIIKERTNNFVPKMAIVLGSGLGKVAEVVENPIVIPYHDLPHFEIGAIAGHAHQLSFGMLHGVPVVCLEGRSHLYEGSEAFLAIRTIMRTLKLIGCEMLFTTNSVGSLRKEVGPGELVAMTDHINFMGENPLVGVPETEMGPYFVSMDNAYDSELRGQLHKVAQDIDVTLHDGVFIGTLGPSFETSAEIRAFKMWGADTVGMSTVPDTIVARKYGLKVLTVSVVTNLAAGMSDEKLSHEVTLKGAARGTENLIKLILEFVRTLK